MAFSSCHFGNVQQHFSTPCGCLVAPVIEGAEILRITAAEVFNASHPSFPVLQAPEVSGVNFCNVTVSLRHHGADDTVFVYVWLPLRGWNGRYQAVGGGGLSAGLGDRSLMHQVDNGYASSWTEAGLTLNQTIDPTTAIWALKEDGSLNEDLLLNLSWRSAHDMAVISKDIIKQFYGAEPEYSYWHGCSQGGRQGYAVASKIPHAFDGILAIAPMLDWPRLMAAELWPMVVMNNMGIPPPCLLEEYRRATLAACDQPDGAIDGLISNAQCIRKFAFDFGSLVGKSITCDEIPGGTDTKGRSKHSRLMSAKTLIVNSTHSAIVRKLMEGPTTADGRVLWHGIAPGTRFDALANISKNDRGSYEAVPFKIAENWIKHIVLRNPTYDVASMSFTEFERVFNESVETQSRLFGDQELDLLPFSQSGGKLLSWTGMSDRYNSPLTLMRYYEVVQDQFGGTQALDEFYRLFLAPGVDHCCGGGGPAPNNAFKALVHWVEDGNSPDVLPAARIAEDGIVTSRNLCRYPRESAYRGGDIRSADSFECKLLGISAGLEKGHHRQTCAISFAQALEDRTVALR
ncbi:hypothetical protein H2204_011006 [Knufia peltigerae]|uniref:Carboxylic ester hydrolase n=1 Tax=Knufia peltigerae TaxID=1002370 RepID=A0AA38XVC0_9EURO|nr:hypothetical protein H2204_011006 [Knufia peltigerae]